MWTPRAMSPTELNARPVRCGKAKLANAIMQRGAAESLVHSSWAIAGELKPLKFLTTLLVEGCQNIDDSAIPALKQLIGLKNLYTKDNAITDAGVAELIKAMPQCKVIR